MLVAGKRGEDERVAACVVAASTFADVNKRVRKLLDVRKASFLPMDRAVADSGMEYGGITPVGLPGGYRVLVDSGSPRTDDGAHGVRGAAVQAPHAGPAPHRTARRDGGGKPRPAHRRTTRGLNPSP